MQFHARHSARAFVLFAGTSFAALFFALAGLGGTSVAGASAPVFYLDIGASASVGVQPTPLNPDGAPTARGYANDLVALEAAKGVALELTQIGCPGESTTTMLYGGDRCYQSPATQMSTAIAFLQSHYSQTGIVTVDLGFNNVVKCLRLASGVSTCLEQGIDTVRQELPRILSTLQAAAGPNVHFVGVGHYDPFLASALLGTTGMATATESLGAMTMLNDTITGIYQSFLMPTAKVARAFRSFDRVLTARAGVGKVATNVAEACNLTWMCQPAPYGPNLHPNDAGYRAIAASIAATLPATL